MNSMKPKGQRKDMHVRLIQHKSAKMHQWEALVVFKTTPLTYREPGTPTTTSTAHQSNRESRSKTVKTR